MLETCTTEAVPVYLNKIQFITCWNYLYDLAQANRNQAESELMLTMLAFIYNILLINLQPVSLRENIWDLNKISFLL